jgi:ubiquinone biosynthesis O-methyltransferase
MINLRHAKFFKSKGPFNKIFIGNNSRLFSNSIHVDQKDDSFFQSIKDWWNVNGTMRTLHSYNDLRIRYLKKHLNKEGLLRSPHPSQPFYNIEFLDVGCGGGILCESLARLGGQVIGIDSNINSYNIASTHLNNYEGEELKYMRSKLKYYHGSSDNFIEDSKNSTKYLNKFDVVTAMEVIEHVNCPRLFVRDLSTLNKEGGHIFLSTINKTNLSYYGMIVGGEKLFRIVPEGTHDWNKFIKPEEIVNILKEYGYCLKDLTGVSYNPLTGNMDFSKDMSMNYILLAKKIKN